MTRQDLNDILNAHKKWRNNHDDGQRADLSKFDLSEADLNGVILRGAVLRFTSFNSANLRNADLRYADLSFADLRGANLRNADLLRAVLHKANLRCADLRNATLSSANLFGANLAGANLQGVKVDYSTCGFFLACPSEGSFTAFKKACGFIVVLEVPADAKRSSATTYKCRCSKAKVLRIENPDGSIAAVSEVRSNHDCDFVYKVGAMVEVPDFDDERWNECSKGIHFFTDRAVAANY